MPQLCFQSEGKGVEQRTCSSPGMANSTMLRLPHSPFLLRSSGSPILATSPPNFVCLFASPPRSRFAIQMLATRIFCKSLLRDVKVEDDQPDCSFQLPLLTDHQGAPHPILCLSNGHGEDSIAASILTQLMILVHSDVHYCHASGAWRRK